MLEDFSVVTIARNEEKTLPRLLESVREIEDVIILDSIPEYVPIFVRNRNTHELDILPISDFFEKNLQNISVTDKKEEVKKVEDWDIWTRTNQGGGFSNSWTPAEYVLRHQYSGQLVRVNTLDSVVDCTPNHSLFSINGKEVEASKLSVGDKILVGGLKNGHNTSKKHYKKIFRGSPEFAWMLGFFSAEGCLDDLERGKRGYGISISNKNKALLERCQQALKDGINCYSHISKEDKNGMCKLKVDGKRVYDFFKGYATTDYCSLRTNGNLVPEKRVPMDVLNSPEYIREAYLSGFMTGDGHHYTEKNYDAFSNISWTLVQGIRFLHHSLGQDSHSVHIRDDKENIITNVVNQGTKKRNIEDIRRIKKIKTVSYTGYVYDIGTSKGRFQAGIGGIIVHNTGSTDHTVVVAKSLGAKVTSVGDMFVEIPENKDIALFKQRYGFLPSFTIESKLFNYAAARNYAMTLAENDFIFSPDADEQVEWDLPAIKELLPTCDQLSYRFCFAHNEDGTPALEFAHCKFFRRSVAHWVKKVHEVVAARDDLEEKENLNRIVYTDKMYLHHWQQPNENRSNMLPKLEYAILEKENDDRNTYYLAREYYYGGLEKADTAIKMFEHYLTLPGWAPERGQAMIFMGDCYKWKGDRQKAVETYHQAIIEDTTRREPLFALGGSYAEWGDPRKAVIFLSAALEIPYNPNYYLNSVDLYTWKIHDLLSIEYDKLGEDKKAQYHWLEAVKAAPNDQRILQNSLWFNRKR